jgi:two-component system cell cycle response regulator
MLRHLVVPGDMAPLPTVSRFARPGMREAHQVARAFAPALAPGLAGVGVAIGLTRPGYAWVAPLALGLSGLYLAWRLLQGRPRVDFEPAAFAVVGAAMTGHVLQSALGAPWEAISYLMLVLLSVAVARKTALALGLFAVAFEATVMLARAAPGPVPAPEFADWLRRAAFALCFAGMHGAFWRVELARLGDTIRMRVDEELARIRDAARAYRLLGAPVAQTNPSFGVVAHPEEVLAQNGLEAIGSSVRFALSMVAEALRLDTVALYWMDEREVFVLRDAQRSESSERVGELRERIEVPEGLIAVVLQKGAPVALPGPVGLRQLPYAQGNGHRGAAAVVPVLEFGVLRGVIVADRDANEVLTESEQQLLRETATFCARSIQNERVFMQLQRGRMEQDALYQAAANLAAATTENEVIEVGIRAAKALTELDFAALTLFDRRSQSHYIRAVSSPNAQEWVGQRFAQNTGLVSMALANRHTLPYRGEYDPAHHVLFDRSIADPNMPSALILPLGSQEVPLGTLVLAANRAHAFSESVRASVEVLTNHLSTALANARMVRRLEELATTDGLTGVLNKRALVELARRKLIAASRFGRRLSIVVCDLDHFKRVNDSYGHAVGDEVLRAFSAILNKSKRATDDVGRFGGEEFVVVCEETDADGAVLLAERVRQQLAEVTFQGASSVGEARPFHVTASMGIATFPDRAANWESLFKLADQALYEAKGAGRDRVVVSGAAAESAA